MDALNKLDAQPVVETKAASKSMSFMDMYKHWEAKRLGIKSLYEETESAGGALTPDEFLKDAIQVARNGAVVLPLATQYSMTSDVLKIPKISTGSSIYWEQTGGYTAKTTTDQVFAYVTLTARTVYGMTAISDQLAEDGNPDAVRTVQGDLAKAMVVSIDKALIEGAGSGADPITGVLNASGVTSTAAGAAFTADDVSGAMGVVEGNIFSSTGCVTHPSVIVKLRDLKDANGQYILSDPRGEGGVRTIFGLPVYTQGSLTSTAGSRAFYVGQWDELIVGMRRGMQIDISKDFYFGNNQIAVRLTARLDGDVKHGEAFAVVTGI